VVAVAVLEVAEAAVAAVQTTGAEVGAVAGKAKERGEPKA
jgi:hypothetical protein